MKQINCWCSVPDRANKRQHRLDLVCKDRSLAPLSLSFADERIKARWLAALSGLSQIETYPYSETTTATASAAGPAAAAATATVPSGGAAGSSTVEAKAPPPQTLYTLTLTADLKGMPLPPSTPTAAEERAPTVGGLEARFQALEKGRTYG